MSRVTLRERLDLPQTDRESGFFWGGFVIGAFVMMVWMLL